MYQVQVLISCQAILGNAAGVDGHTWMDGVFPMHIFRHGRFGWAERMKWELPLRGIGHRNERVWDGEGMEGKKIRVDLSDAFANDTSC